MAATIPVSVQKYFWGDDIGQLQWPLHRDYITQTVLERGDSTAVSWLFHQVPKKELFSLLDSIRLSPKSQNFWHLYLS